MLLKAFIRLESRSFVELYFYVEFQTRINNDLINVMFNGHQLQNSTVKHAVRVLYRSVWMEIHRKFV